MRMEKVKDDKIAEVLEKVREIFERYNYREDIERALQDYDFKIWNYTMFDDDEQIWYYDDGDIPNMQVLLLVNWIDGFCTIYRKEYRIML